MKLEIAVFNFVGLSFSMELFYALTFLLKS